MNTELIFTNNNLSDILIWLKLGNIVCIHTELQYNYYYLKENINDNDDINHIMLIYINVSKMSSLLEFEEWPWYIENEGFIRYKSISILPTDKNKIHYLSI